MQAWPPVISGAAAASGLNAIAAPHNPALATNLTLNRPKIVININSFIRAQIFPQSNAAAEPHSRTEVVFRRPTQLLAVDVEHEPRRTAPFPNGDVRTRWSLKKGAGPQRRMLSRRCHIDDVKADVLMMVLPVGYRW
jgi:hypothetical protein